MDEKRRYEEGQVDEIQACEAGDMQCNETVCGVKKNNVN